MNLPKDLEEVYLQALQKAKQGRHARDVHNLLLWLLYAHKPLSLRQITEILTIDFQNQTMRNKNSMKPKLHVMIDSSLVTVGTDNMVQFAHASVKEFLIQSHTLIEMKDLFLFYYRLG